jgi:phage gp36-like protein
MSDTWIILAKSDVQASINDTELEALLNTAIAGGQPDPTTVLIPDVTAEVRGYVRRRNTLGPTGTIPQELKDAAIDIICYRCAQRIGGSEAAKNWKARNEEAVAKLVKVAEGAIYVSAPETPTTETTSAPGPALPPFVPRRFGYDEERGI